MPNSELLASVNEKLDLVTFMEVDDCEFELVGSCSSWLLNFCPDLEQSNTLNLKNTFVFLESFIEQSREYFIATEERSLGSGPWSERDINGVECNLSATALEFDTKLVVQVRYIPAEQLYHRRVFQKAREYSLEFERLQHEKAQKEVLVYAIVHDLSGPLTAVSGMVDMIELVENDETEKQRLLAQAQSQIGISHRMIKSVLEVFDEQANKFDRANLDAEKAPDLVSILEPVVTDFYPAFRQQGVTLTLNNRVLDGDYKVVAEALPLSRVFTNLLVNALRYSSVDSSVTVSIDSDEKELTVSVADQGAGVPEELVASLFQRFVGGQKYGGKAGFGLYYCQMCTHKWGGKISYSPNRTAEGESTQGACFQVTLPKYVG